MSPVPTGRLHGNDLVLTRTFRAPIEDVWQSVTHSESTARWIGRWEGDAGPGRKIRIQLAFEQDQPWSEATIDQCDAPRHLALTTNDASGTWKLEITLTQRGDETELRFVHHLSDRSGVGEIGPGWEYYLDNLVAARAGAALPAFSDYYPSQRDFYLGLP